MSAVPAPPPEAPGAVVICPVLPFPAISGTTKRTLRLLEAMDRAGARPHVIASAEAGPGGLAELRARGWGADLAQDPAPGPARRLAQHVARRPSPYLRSVERRLAELGGRVAFVQAEHAMSAYYRGASRPAPAVLSMHNVDSAMLATVAAAERPLSPGWARQWNRALATRSVERREAPRADAVLCVSDEDAAHFERLGARTLVVPNGIDDDLLALPGELPAAPRALFFGHLGYLPNLRGLRRFLAEGGWSHVREHEPEAELRIVGPGLTDALAAELGAAPGVVAAGLVDDIAAELAGAALVLVPIWQGGGTRLKVLEALAAARPVAGTALGVAGIGFRDGVHGLLAERPAELGAAAVALLRDRALARRLGAEGRRLADGFRWSAVTRPAEELYARWASAPG